MLFLILEKSDYAFFLSNFKELAVTENYDYIEIKEFVNPIVLIVKHKISLNIKNKFVNDIFILINMKYEKYSNAIILKIFNRINICEVKNKFLRDILNIENTSNENHTTTEIGCINNLDLLENPIFIFLKENFSVILLKRNIRKNIKRSPVHEIIYSSVSKEEFYTSVKQMGIIFYWNPFFTMFSSGNNTERIRMRNQRTDNETILDLYCGIGYFLIPLLLNNPSSNGIACEINKYSQIALIKNIEVNKLQNRITICCGNHSSFIDLYINKCDRIIMGYLPCPFEGIKYAVIALKNTGTIHFHKVIEKNETESYFSKIKDHLLKYFEDVKLESLTKVKSYSVRQYHFVFDIKVLNKLKF
ncbi:methyltransferase [Hamiltosporidium magnivora]|uniref:Methyltransferase n=1 Tax=Hamiltosporidium magnivora TaxID=148818 RepID=A0A4Q9L662_9MICR|nr:Taw2p [Hamiltosporidium tvaerminnensis]TBU02655.1 methyltransferase [Hamiltosporidium magnivora]